MTAAGVLGRGLDAVAFDCLGPKTDRRVRIGFCQFDPLFNRKVHRLQVVTVRHGNHVPPQRAHRRKCGLHRVSIFGDAPGELGVVVRNHQHVRVHSPFGGQTGNSGERFFGLALHRRAIADGANRHAIPFGDPVGDGQALRLRQGRTERTVAEQHTFGIEMRLAVAGELAFDAAERFQVVKRHLIEAVVGSQRVDAVLSVARVVNEVKRLIPFAALRREHDAVDRRHDFCKGRRPAPVTSRPTIDGVHIDQRQQRARGARIAQDHFLAGGIFDLNGVFRSASRRARETRRQIQRRQRWCFDLVNDRFVFGHRAGSDRSKIRSREIRSQRRN